MTLRILISPANTGKTAWVVKQALDRAASLRESPRIVVPSRLQSIDFERRLAVEGGAMGVVVGTFRDISREILDLAGSYPVLISEITQGKLLQEILNELDLKYYAGIKGKPGFIQASLGIIRELEAGGILPGQFTKGADSINQGLRLKELALVYEAYRNRLGEKQWVDPIGLTWMAGDVLGENPELCKNWDFVVFDGFDDLSPIQLRLIETLSGQLPEVTVTITGLKSGTGRPLVHKRFNRLREVLLKEQEEETYLIEPDLPQNPNPNPFKELEEALFQRSERDTIDVRDLIEMAAVPDREAEVRTALRWIRLKIMDEGIQPRGTALIMRNQEPYRALVNRAAKEYGLPVRIQGGIPLGENPLIASILSILRLAASGREGLVWHEVVSLWRSPYFDSSLINPQGQNDVDQADQMGEANQLAETARWGRVIQGYQQWEEAFLLLTGLVDENEEYSSRKMSLPESLPKGDEAKRLWRKFSLFTEIISPPGEKQTLERHISWVEDLLGNLDLDEEKRQGFGVFHKILEGSPGLIQRDWQALKTLTDIFREQVWSDSVLDGQPITFIQFFNDLEAVINKSSYQPVPSDQDAIVCADCTEVRGIPFRAVALLGLAEGEFPETIKEDPFLRDKDRKFLLERYGLPLRLSTDSAEAEYFYESLTRSFRYLLITRPRIADNGTLWQPSPFWEEILRLLTLTPALLTTRSVPPLRMAASQSELMEFLASEKYQNTSFWQKAEEIFPSLCQKILFARRVLAVRSGDPDFEDLVYDGGLGHLQKKIILRFPADHVWSASRLENYQSCPFNFFIGNLLGLEKPEPPSEGLDTRQLGNIYHHILEDLYQSAGEDYGIEDLLRELPYAAKKVFKQAPAKEGFRETAWWQHTQEEILANLRLSIITLESLDTTYKFYRAEQRFGIYDAGEPHLVIKMNEEGSYNLRGFIDRVDINSQGGIRIIDYKTSGAFGFDNRAVWKGKKLQLPLYALAAQQALKLGSVQEGFYFHVLSAQPSSFKMSSYWGDGKKGPKAAMESAKKNGWRAVLSIQKGNFRPKPPGNGCPAYCPAVNFCWHYRPKRW